MTTPGNFGVLRLKQQVTFIKFNIRAAFNMIE